MAETEIKESKPENEPTQAVEPVEEEETQKVTKNKEITKSSIVINREEAEQRRKSKKPWVNWV